jgi:hypothetical protein
MLKLLLLLHNSAGEAYALQLLWTSRRHQQKDPNGLMLIASAARSSCHMYIMPWACKAAKCSTVQIALQHCRPQPCDFASRDCAVYKTISYPVSSACGCSKIWKHTYGPVGST